VRADPVSIFFRPKEGANGSFVRDCLLDSLENEFVRQKAVLDNNVTDNDTPRLFLFVNTLCMFSTMLSIKVAFGFGSYVQGNVLFSLQGKPLRPLIAAVYEILERSVQQRSEQYVRFSIQTLKTVGAHLESAEKLFEAEKTQKMDKLIDTIECIGAMQRRCFLLAECDLAPSAGTEADSRLSDNTKFMIRNLRGVRRHWAYVAPPPPSPLPAPATAFYDNQLQVISGELRGCPSVPVASSQPGAPFDDGLLDVSSGAALSNTSGYLDASSSSLTPYSAEDYFGRVPSCNNLVRLDSSRDVLKLNI